VKGVIYIVQSKSSCDMANVVWMLSTGRNISVFIGDTQEKDSRCWSRLSHTKKEKYQNAKRRLYYTVSFNDLTNLLNSYRDILPVILAYLILLLVYVLKFDK
jgi:hypothetical protein